MCGRFTMVMADELEGIVRAIECRAPYVAEADWPAQAPDAFPGSEVAVLRLADASDGAAARPAVASSNGEAVGALDAVHACASGGETVGSRRTALEGVSRDGAVSPLAIAPLIWGFDLPGQGKTVFNTRSETAASSNFWRESFLQRRCVVPARAFFEPHRSERALRPGGIAGRGGAKTVKQTYRFADEGGGILLLAGIWSADRFSILTTQPDAAVSPVHDRMPVILRFEDALAWMKGEKALSSARGAGGSKGSERQPASALRSEPMYPPAVEAIQQRLF